MYCYYLPPKYAHKYKSMAQVFLVLKCVSCETFQVSQVKKTNKWVCKICNEKQSITKVYGRGSSADCRKHVQKLNLARGEKDATERMHPADEYVTTSPQDPLGSDTDGSQTHMLGSDTEGSQTQLPVLVTSQDSKWAVYCDQAPELDEDVDCDGPFTTERAVYDVCEVASKRKKRANGSISTYTPINDQSVDLIGESITDDTPEGQYRQLEATGPPDIDPPTSQAQSGRPYHRDEISRIRTDISQFVTDNGTTKTPPTTSRWSRYVSEQSKGGSTPENTQ